MIPNYKFISRVCLVLFLLLGTTELKAQIVMSPPVPAGGSSGFTKICAGQDFGSGPFNSYNVTIAWTGTVNSDNEFILELSDASGDFTNAVELGRVSDQNNANPKMFDVNFAIPTDTRGEGYKFRAKSTSPAAQEDSDASYPVYYMDITSSLNISIDGDGNPPGSVCSLNPIVLQVDNIANPETYSYVWYRSGTLLSGETGHTLNVATSGMYQAVINYGNCTNNGNSFSNIVDALIGVSGVGIGITPPSKTALCPGDTETLTIDATNPGWNYQWYKDGVAIPGAIAGSYVVNASLPLFAADYQVEISGVGICTERSPAISITDSADFTITRDNPADLVILPTQPETLSITTNASSPSFRWFRNGAVIPGETNIALDITQEGTYYVEVTQTAGTCPVVVKNSETTVATIPASLEAIIDYTSTYTNCVSTSIVLEVSTINAIASDGGITDVTAQLKSALSYQWNRNGAPVAGATSESISLTDITENGNYEVTASIATYTDTSNTLPVNLLTNETLEITSNGTVYCSTGDTITLESSIDLSGESFDWQRDGTSINTTDTSLVISEPGTYRLVFDANGCSLISNDIVITTLDPGLITLDVDGDIIFPEGSSQTVTATGGTAYRWLDSDNTIMSTTDSMTFTTEGDFLLIANIDNCEVSRELTVVYRDVFNIPNVITPNGDGSNDQWTIPNTYSNQSDVTVTIFNDRGVPIINETSYQNDWPRSTSAFPRQSMVFYYVIKNTTETLKQGTITVIR